MVAYENDDLGNTKAGLKIVFLHTCSLTLLIIPFQSDSIKVINWMLYVFVNFPHLLPNRQDKIPQ